MRVVVNELTTLARRTGIGHYTSELLRAVRGLVRAPSVTGFPGEPLRALCRGMLHTRSRLEPGQGSPDRSGSPTRRAVRAARSRLLDVLKRGTLTALARCFRDQTSHGRYDLYHEPNFIPLPTDCPTVVTVHDLSVVHHPEWHPADRVRHFEENFFRGLRRCRHVLTLTEAARRDVIRTLGVNPRQVTSVHLGVRPGLRPMGEAEVAATLTRLRVPPQFVLHVGTIEPRKNLLMLLRAYCALPPALRDQWPLLLVGGWGWRSEPVAEYLHQEARHRGVIHLGYLPDADLAAVYHAARVLVMPSFDEGFGLPPLEMMARGGAVVTSTAPALLELVGGCGHHIDADDVDGWRSGLRRALTDDDWCRLLRRGARARAAEFSWERCATETLAVYRQACGISPFLRPGPHTTRSPAVTRRAG